MRMGLFVNPSAGSATLLAKVLLSSCPFRATETLARQKRLDDASFLADEAELMQLGLNC